MGCDECETWDGSTVAEEFGAAAEEEKSGSGGSKDERATAAGWTRPAAATASALVKGLNPKEASPPLALATACGELFFLCVHTAGISCKPERKEDFFLKIVS